MSTNIDHKSLDSAHLPALYEVLDKQEDSLRLRGRSVERKEAQQSADLEWWRIEGNMRIALRYYENVKAICEPQIDAIDADIEDIGNRKQYAYDYSMDAYERDGSLSAKKYSSQALQYQREEERLSIERDKLTKRIQSAKGICDEVREVLMPELVEAGKAFIKAQNAAVVAETKYKLVEADRKKLERDLMRRIGESVKSKM